MGRLYVEVSLELGEKTKESVVVRVMDGRERRER
jgi:hypothetical protein